MIIHRHGDLLLGPKVSLCGQNRGVSQQKLDLFEIATGFSAEFGAGAAEIMGTKPFDPNLFGRCGDDRPDRPVTQTLPDFATFLIDRSSRPSSIRIAISNGLIEPAQEHSTCGQDDHVSTATGSTCDATTPMLGGR